MPAEALLTDQVYTYLYANPGIDFTQIETIDLDGFRNNLRDSINKRVGEELIHDVMVEQIDFLSKQEIRDNTIRRADRPATSEGRKAASRSRSRGKAGPLRRNAAPDVDAVARRNATVR